jgi:uncharacterized protein DUF3300
MRRRMRTFGFGAFLAAIFAMLVTSGTTLHAQQDPVPVPAQQLLSPDQLDDLVAPIALYPDPLISQILVATTYPLEVVEASQWLQRNPNLRDEALTQAALNQDWDPSVQALVVFPGVLKYLTEDIAWTTNLGNAFLAQEGDVMDAIQRMRDRAARSGKLMTTAEQQVIRVQDSGQPVYEILPTNPTVVYVPVYDPYWIWGAPVYYPYARWYYPPHVPTLYFGSVVYIDAYFGTRWYGSPWNGPGYQAWNNWGWRPAWNNRTVVVNNVFIDNHHFNSNRIQSTGTVAWSHDVSHRRGVVYPTTASFDRYRRDPRDVPRQQQVVSQGYQGRSGPAQLTSRSAGSINTSNAPRPVERSNDRFGGQQNTQQRVGPQQAIQQNGRPEPRQDSRPGATSAPAPRQGQDTRVAGPTPTNRDTRVASDYRSNRESSYAGSNRVTSNTAPVTQARSSQLALSRPSNAVPAVSSPQTSSNGARYSAPSREIQTGRSVGSSMTRTEAPTSYRETASNRGREDYSRPVGRQAGPGAVAAPQSYSSAPRQSASVRESAPSVSYSRPQQSAPSANVQMSSPRQSAPSGGSASAVRSAPAQEHGRSSNSEGSSRNSGGSNGGGNSRGRR